MSWNLIDTNYLQHHGILGMNWGKRNGPPYPLGASDHSASEKKAGWRKSLNSSDYDRVRSLRKKKKKQLSNDELKEIAERNRLELAARRGDIETRRLMIKCGTTLITSAAFISAAAIGGKYIMDHADDIAYAVAKATTKAGIAATKATGTEIGKEAVKAGHNIRKAAATSKGAKAYVKGVRRLLGK